jgi:glutathione S-transferase
MPQIPTQRDDLRMLRGVHLWHAGNSNCSQRVRLVLEEKAVAWEGHLVDLFNFEHASPDYKALHPQGLVPALIHDGLTIIDSNDIIAYIDTIFPGDGSLQPSNESAELTRLLAMASDAQRSLRILSHEFMFSDVRRYGRDRLEYFGANHPNSEFAQFLWKFSVEGFSPAELLECHAIISTAAEALDLHLARHLWLAGDAISLADFCWVPNVHRLELFDFPLDRHAHLLRWLDGMKARPSYGVALGSYEKELPQVSEEELTRRAAFFANADAQRGAKFF